MPRKRTDPGHGSAPPRYAGSFLLAFREAAERLGWKVGPWRGRSLRCADGDGHEHLVALENLYRSARRSPRDDWPTLIGDFLKTVAGADRAAEAVTDLAAVADQLLPRIGPPFPNEPREAPLWDRPVPGTGLVVNMVVDYPDRMLYVTENLIAASEQSADAWWERALANLHKRTAADCFQTVHAESGLRACTQGDAYDSARVLLLAQLWTEPAPDGFFVGLPNRDYLLVLPVSSGALAYVHLLKLLAERHYRTAPYPLSDLIYWFTGGSWHVFPMHVRAGRVLVEPPEAFAATLQRLLPTGEPAAEDPPPADEGPEEPETEA